MQHLQAEVDSLEQQLQRKQQEYEHALRALQQQYEQIKQQYEQGLHQQVSLACIWTSTTYCYDTTVVITMYRTSAELNVCCKCSRPDSRWKLPLVS